MQRESQPQQQRRPPMPPLSLLQMRSQNTGIEPEAAQSTTQVPRSARTGTHQSTQSMQRSGALVRNSSQPRVLLPAQVQGQIDQKEAQEVQPSDRAAQANEEAGMGQIRIKTLLLEYQLLQKYAPIGVFLVPADPLPNDPGPKLAYWKGVYFVKQGIYQDAVLKFRITFPKDYPRSMPLVHFQSEVFHPLVDQRTRQLKIDKDFGDWNFGKNWLIQVLLFVKKIFHLEQYFGLGGEKEHALNGQAFDLYHTNFVAFVDRCIECVQRSIDDKFQQDQTKLQLSEPSSATDEIQQKLESLKDVGNDTHAKEQLKNYFKHNLPDQLKQKNPAAAATLMPQMSVMTALQSRVMRD